MTQVACTRVGDTALSTHNGKLTRVTVGVFTVLHSRHHGPSRCFTLPSPPPLLPSLLPGRPPWFVIPVILLLPFSSLWPQPEYFLFPPLWAIDYSLDGTRENSACLGASSFCSASHLLIDSLWGHTPPWAAVPVFRSERVVRLNPLALGDSALRQQHRGQQSQTSPSVLPSFHSCFSARSLPLQPRPLPGSWVPCPCVAGTAPVFPFVPRNPPVRPPRPSPPKAAPV